MQSQQRQKLQHYFRLMSLFTYLTGTLVLIMLPGCTGFTSIDAKFGHVNPPSGVHKVRVGDTLFSIAWRYGWDYKELAVANSINPPYTIFPGQIIDFEHRQYLSATPAHSQKKSPKKLTNTTIATKSSAQSAYKSRPRKPKSTKSTPLSTWSWPTSGNVIANFSSKSPVNKGIDIAGRLGEPVTAAAAGTVVYAGSGLLGYGNLVIIKHNDRFLSAYAHNKRLLVKENQKVTARQPIAEVGSSGTDSVKLHFEIRRDGKPVNPIKYLPKRG